GRPRLRLRLRARQAVFGMMLPATIALASCQASVASKSKPGEPKAAVSIGGDATAGKQLFVAKGCVACHKAPGVPEAQGVVGPDLKGVAGRPKLGAVLDNTPENMRRWLLDPQSAKPGTSIPSHGLTESEA